MDEKIEEKEIHRIAVVGAGLMGHGIAQEFALAGFEVCMHSRTESSLQQAQIRITKNLTYLSDVGHITSEEATSVSQRLHKSTSIAEAVSHADLVIESVFENLELKRQIFAELDRLCPIHTIMASNTSGLMPSSFADATSRPDKVLVTHYANPPHLMPLVEVVPGSKTSESTVEFICALLTKIGKRPIVIHKEVPGFVLNRLQCALLREALWLIENDVVTAKDVDYAISNSIGRRWSVAGIFQIFELAGWDLVSTIAEQVFPHLAATSDLSPVLRAKLSDGHLGAKTDKGFYDWSSESANALQQRISNALLKIEQWD